MRIRGLWAALLVLVVASLAAAAEAQTTQQVADPSAPAAQKPAPADPRNQPTHQQTAIIKVVDDQNSTQPLLTFCLDKTGRILAGVGSATGEIRVYDADGKYLASWKLPVVPEAINIGPDGLIYAAGKGQLLKLDAQGQILLQKESPHAAAVKANAAKLREQVLAQGKQQAESIANACTVYEKQIATLKEQIEKLTAKGEATLTDVEKQRLATTKQSLNAYEQQLKVYQQYLKTNPVKELTEEQVQQQVQRMSESKLRLSSIAVSGQDVFITCSALVGYGFEVWRTDVQFTGGEQIIGQLVGCCGQMDVRANPDGVFVAENARHRVSRYDRLGKKQLDWGQGERTGVEGFSSCCNPMNVAFGPGSEVYTAEATTGRIKRFTASGQYLGLVGQAELVPGCKNVAIAVSQDGSRVYMMDLTRTHIVLLTKKPAATVKVSAQPVN